MIKLVIAYNKDNLWKENLKVSIAVIKWGSKNCININFHVLYLLTHLYELSYA